MSGKIASHLTISGYLRARFVEMQCRKKFLITSKDVVFVDFLKHIPHF